MTILNDETMINYEKIEIFLKSILTAQDEYKLADYLKVWDVGSREWEEVAMSIFESKLLYPLSQVVEYIRQGRQIDLYIDHIALLKAPEMVKREKIFSSLKRFRAENKEAVQRVLCAIYEDGDLWDTLDSAIKGSDLKVFEDSMGSDERAANLKKIVCHHLSIVESPTPLYHRCESPNLVESDGAEPTSSSLEEQKTIAKEILSICAKLMLTAKEESYIKQIYNNPLIKNELSIDVSRYYYRIREKRATLPKKVEAQLAQPEPQSQQSEYYTKKEAMKLLDVCSTTLYNWRDEELPRHKIGRKVYYLKSDIEKAMDKMKKKGCPSRRK